MVERRRRGTKLPEIYGMCRPFEPLFWLCANPALTRGAIPCRRFAPQPAVWQPLDTLFRLRASKRENIRSGK